jgi:hypothetical protein
MSRKTIEVDSDMIDHSLEELSKLIIQSLTHTCQIHFLLFDGIY